MLKIEIKKKSTEWYNYEANGASVKMMDHLSGNHFRIVILKQRENVFGSSSELPFRHVFEIGDLNDGIDSTRVKLQQLNSSLKNLHSPPQELLQFLIIAKYPLVHFSIFKDSILVVADRVPLSVESQHISHNPFQLFEP